MERLNYFITYSYVYIFYISNVYGVIQTHIKFNKINICAMRIFMECDSARLFKSKQNVMHGKKFFSTWTLI
jgi:hypothetical protein